MRKGIDRDTILNIVRDFGWEVEVLQFNERDYAKCTIPSCVDGNYSMIFLAETAHDVREGIDDEVYKLDVEEYVKRWKNAKFYYGMPGIPDVPEIEKEGNRIYDLLSRTLSDIDALMETPPQKVYNFLEH